MKKILAIAILFFSLVLLCACGDSGSTGSDKISVKKTSSHSAAITVSPGGRIAYTVTVLNEGDSRQTLCVKDALPDGCTYVSGDFRAKGTELSCNITLNAGESKALGYIFEVSKDMSEIKEGRIVATEAIAGEESASCNDVYVGYTFSDADMERMRSGIIAISYSENINAQTLARQMYNVAFSKLPEINATADAILADIFSSEKSETRDAYLNIAVPTVYGGKSVTDAISVGLKGASTLPEGSDFIVGDILLVKNKDTSDFYIFDGKALLLLNDGCEKKDAKAILSALCESDLYVALRPSLAFDESFGFDNAADPEGLTEAQKALLATARAYFWRGYRLQYDDTRMSATYQSQSDRGEFRWQIGLYQPEDYTSEKWGYVNCAAFTYDLYLNALGMDLGGLYTTAKLASYYVNGGAEGALMYPYNLFTSSCTGENAQNAEIERFMSTLEVGDLIVVRRNSGSGHVMMYVGNDTVIHSSGSSFDYGKDSETYEPTVRYMNIRGYLFHPEATNYIFREDNYVTQLCVVRPLDKFSGTIPENTVNRIENLGDIISEKLSSHREGMTVNTGETITYTFRIKNVGTAAKALTVTDKIPSGTVLASSGDARVSGDTLSWQISVAPGEEISVSYSVRVTATAGTFICGKYGSVGGVSHNCPGVYVGATLDGSEQARLLESVNKFRESNPQKLTGLALVDAIYRDAGLTSPLGVSDSAPRSSLFKSVKDSTGNSLVWTLNTESAYYSAVAPTLYGGRRFFTPMKYTDAKKINSDRSRLAREQALVIGDILITKFSSSEAMYMYVGDGVLVNLMKVEMPADNYTATVRLMRMNSAGNYYAVLRPSLMK